MRSYRFLLFCLCAIIIFLPSSEAFYSAHGTQVPSSGGTFSRESIAGAYGKLPIGFEPNLGQFERQFQFGTRGIGYGAFLSSTGASVRVRSNHSSKGTNLGIVWRGANDYARMRGVDKLRGEANYFYGGSENWITHVPTYQRIIAESVYPGIDVAYYGNQGRFEYDFIVKPGASPEAIDIAFSGSQSLTLADNGDVLISVGGLVIRQSKPDVYQESGGRRLKYSGSYILRAADHVSFKIGEYDRSKPLIIDPQLVYSTYALGLTREYGVAVDSGGNAYICGTTDDGGPNDQATNAFAAKLNSDGSAFLWKNSFGSFGYSDSATGIAVDASGNAYVTGWTFYQAPPPAFPPFPTTTDALQGNPGGGSDAFVTKFDTNGEMLYSTFLGGSGDDAAEGIAVDPIGNIYLSGRTASADFPTFNPFQSALGGSSNAFVTAINPQGSAFLYSTYIGGSYEDGATAIAVDPSGNAYVTGSTTSPDFPTANAILPSWAGGIDTFIFKMNPAGSALVYGTYLGGSGDDTPTGIAVDSSNNAYVAGRTNSTDFPTVSAFQPALAGGFDEFVTKVNSTGTAFSYSTYLGGSSDETTGGIWCEENPTCGGIAVNSDGNAYVTGVTASSDFPQVRSVQPFKGTSDAFVTVFSVDGTTLIYSTLLGGANPEMGTGTSTFSSGSAVAYFNGNVYVVGLTDNSDFPTASNAAVNFACCVNPVWDGIDGFIAKLADDSTSGGAIGLVQSNAVEGSGVSSVD